MSRLVTTPLSGAINMDQYSEKRIAMTFELVIALSYLASQTFPLTTTGVKGRRLKNVGKVRSCSQGQGKT